jgi:hypothetical protein
METLQAKLDEKFSKVETLFEKQSACESEGKRCFEAILSHDSHELCQRDDKSLQS